MSKVKTTVYIEPEMLKALRKLSDDDERPMAYHHNKALRAYGPIKKLTKGVEVKKGKALAAIRVMPDGLNQGAWLEWSKSPSSKITNASREKQLKLLTAYSMADQQLIIDASINSGWQGLFPLKGQQKATEGFVEKHTDDDWKADLLAADD